MARRVRPCRQARHRSRSHKNRHLPPRSVALESQCLLARQPVAGCSNVLVVPPAAVFFASFASCSCMRVRIPCHAERLNHQFTCIHTSTHPPRSYAHPFHSSIHPPMDPPFRSCRRCLSDMQEELHLFIPVSPTLASSLCPQMLWPLQPCPSHLFVQSSGTGPWYDVDSYEAHAGGGLVSLETPIDKIAVLQRGGSIVSRKLRLRRSSKLMRHDP